MAGLAVGWDKEPDFEQAPKAHAAKIHPAQMISNLMITDGTTGFLRGTRHR